MNNERYENMELTYEQMENISGGIYIDQWIQQTYKPIQIFDGWKDIIK